MNSLNVLVIDDDLVNLEIMSSALDSVCGVFTESTGKKGLEIASIEPYPDMILLDVMMPDMTGYEVIEKLKKSPITRHIPVVFITTLDSDDDETQGLKLGAIDFIHKPVSLELLRVRIGNHLERIMVMRKLEEAKEIAEEANRFKTNFLANMSHELRTPMHGILSYSKMGISRIEKSTEEKNLRYFTNINKSGERLLVLINDLLDLAKLESGKMTMSFSQCSLKEIAVTCIEEQQARLVEMDLSIEWDKGGNHGYGVFDEVRIGQLITNLLSNAIKYTPKGAKIELLIEKLEVDSETTIPSYKFSVHDYGVGIPEGELSLIFNKFAQSSTSESVIGGTGLGLSICKEIINCHNGKIWAENHKEGGAVFSFILPVDSSDLK